MILPDSRIMVAFRANLNKTIIGTTPAVFGKKMGINNTSQAINMGVSQALKLGVRMEEGLLVHTMRKCTVVFVTRFLEHALIVIVKVILFGTTRHR